MLAVNIRRYFSVQEAEDKQHELMVKIASIMVGITGRLLEGNESWGPHRSVDAIAPSCPAEMIAPGHIVVDGLLIFFDRSKGRGEWWEPFYGSVRIAEVGDEILNYELKFGDAAWGLGNVGYGEHPRGWNWSRPEKWIFAFAKP